MKGYIVLNSNMQTNRNKSPMYLQKVYNFSSAKGFPFVRNLEDIGFLKKRLRKYKVIEIWTDDNDVYIPERNCICRTKSLRLCREVPQWEIRNYLSENIDEIIEKEFVYRSLLANYGVGLDRLVNDELWIIRMMVAEKGYGLDILKDDDEFEVRRACVNYVNKRNAS